MGKHPRKNPSLTLSVRRIGVLTHEQRFRGFHGSGLILIPVARFPLPAPYNKDRVAMATHAVYIVFN